MAKIKTEEEKLAEAREAVERSMRKKKRAALISILVFIPVVIIGFVLGAAASGKFSSDWEYDVLEDGTFAITDYSGHDSELSIPEVINGKPVTAIGSKAFYNNGRITSVVIPDSVTTIGDDAFSYCGGMNTISLGGVTSIGSRAFKGCDSLTEITIPESVISIGNDAFYSKDLTVYAPHEVEYYSVSGERVGIYKDWVVTD